MCSEYDVYGFSAACALLMLAPGVSWLFPSSGPLSSLWPSPQVGPDGISWDLRRVVQSRTWQIRLSLAASRLSQSGGLWGCRPSDGSSSCGCSHRGRGSRWRAVASGGCLTDAGSVWRERLRDVTSGRAARACGGCEGWLGAWRRRNLPDKQNMLPATSSAWSQLCVSLWILEPRGGFTQRMHNSAVKMPRPFLSCLTENQAWSCSGLVLWRSSLRRFVCTLSLANGRWKWETPRLLSFPHQSLFFFGPVWRLLDSISGPARIVILESVFVGTSTGTDIRSSSLHPVFSCYLFIAEYAEAAFLFFWRRPRRCPFSASLSHPLPPSPFPMSSSSPLCVISLSGYHSFS